MTKIWPRKVSRKIQIQKQIQIFRIQGRREKSRPDRSIGGSTLGSTSPPTRSTLESTWGSTWGSTSLVGQVGLVHLFWLLGPVLEACDDF